MRDRIFILDYEIQESHTQKTRNLGTGRHSTNTRTGTLRSAGALAKLVFGRRENGPPNRVSDYGTVHAAEK